MVYSASNTHRRTVDNCRFALSSSHRVRSAVTQSLQNKPPARLPTRVVKEQCSLRQPKAVVNTQSSSDPTPPYVVDFALLPIKHAFAKLLKRCPAQPVSRNANKSPDNTSYSWRERSTADLMIPISSCGSWPVAIPFLSTDSTDKGDGNATKTDHSSSRQAAAAS